MIKAKSAAQRAAMKKWQAAGAAAKRKGKGGTARGNTKKALLREYRRVLSGSLEMAARSNKGKHKVNRVDLSPGSKDRKNIMKGAANTMRDRIRLRNYSTGRTKSYGGRIKTKF